MTASHHGVLYSLPLSAGASPNAAPAQFVFPGNDSDFIAGFIYEVDRVGMLLKICLFDPIHVLPSGAVLIADNLTMDDIEPLLADALVQNPAMKSEWAKLVRGDE